MTLFDAIVIGTGQAGPYLTSRLAGAGGTPTRSRSGTRPATASITGGFPRRSDRSGASRVPGMTKWEYLTAPILTHAAKQILDNFGSDGWELVQIAAGMNPENLVGYFKRPIEG